MGLALRAPGLVLLILGAFALFDGGLLTLLGLVLIAAGGILLAAQLRPSPAAGPPAAGLALRTAPPPPAPAWTPPPVHHCENCGLQTNHGPVCADCHNAFIRSGTAGLEFRRFLVRRELGVAPATE